MGLKKNIKIADASDFESVRKLFSSYFGDGGRLTSYDYYKWIYLDNPNGKSVFVVSESDGILVGFLALVPVLLSRGDQRRNAFYVINVLVHPEFHGKNIFGSMIDSALEFASENNCMLLGHPNDAALNSWKRKGMNFMPILQPSLAVNFRFFTISLLSFFKGKRVKIKSFDGINCLLNESSFFRVHLTPDYIKWRYSGNPFDKYRVVYQVENGNIFGYAATKSVFGIFNMLIDIRSEKDEYNSLIKLLPFFTLIFSPGKISFSIALPINKRIKWFVHNCNGVVDNQEFSQLLFPPSDF